MHEGEVATDAALVRRLLAAQFPQWAELAIAPVASAGTDNALYRLGADMVVRMPRIHWAAGQVDKEMACLPRLAPHLPLAVSLPLARGAPGESYPWTWGVYRWLEGETAIRDRLTDPLDAARAVGGFVAALQRIDATGGPPPGEHNSGRGVPLGERDARTRDAISRCVGMIDTAAVMAGWERALAAPPWSRPPVWVHGDIQSGNLLARNGRLAAVIDFGCLGVGDPAVDMIVAWNLFNEPERAAFRAALGVDDATWERGRGWALSVGVIALPYYRDTNPTLVAMNLTAIAAVLAAT